DIQPLEEVSKALKKYLEQRGFTCLKEDVNAMDAWLGSIPGHGSCNVRRVFLNSINLAHVLPLHSIYAGNAFSSKSSLLPASSPPVFYAATTGKTPFRFQLDVGDVGHQIILGPTGGGKSTWLGFLIAQFLRYKNAQIFVFDKDYSHQALTQALGGTHYDIGNAETLAFCPLAELSTDTHKMRAESFVENLIALQGVAITPTVRSAIHDAIYALARDESEGSRNITVLRSMIQDQSARDALKFYTIEGQFRLLDATYDSLRTHYLQTFEMGWLLAQKPEIYLPVLLYIFDQIESRLDKSNGLNPTLIILEEAWLYIAHEVFANKLRDWLKTLRKKNARVIFATQSLSDLYDPQTKTLTRATSAIMESCPTRIYLPNSRMEADTKSLYEKIGLTERQLDIISHVAIPKRHYYVVTPEGNRLVDLGFSDIKPLALSFIGLSKENGNMLMEYIKKYGDEWPYHWLESKGFCEWAGYWVKKNKVFNEEEVGA
ncbi:MAG: helicase HerA domain-containing protein, partial [Gammaproteobacteria bacterium]